jgi:hypothetical protein
MTWEYRTDPLSTSFLQKEDDNAYSFTLIRIRKWKVFTVQCLVYMNNQQLLVLYLLFPLTKVKLYS